MPGFVAHFQGSDVKVPLAQTNQGFLDAYIQNKKRKKDELLHLVVVTKTLTPWILIGWSLIYKTNWIFRLNATPT